MNRILTFAVIGFVGLSASADVLFVGEGSSGSGSLNVKENWQSGSVPGSSDTIQFNQSGNLTMSADLTVNQLNVRGVNKEIQLSTGSQKFSVKEFFCGQGSDNNTTFSIGAGSAFEFLSGGHLYLGFESIGDILKVGEGAKVTGAAGVRIGYSTPSNSHDNRLEIGKDAEVSLGNILLGDGGTCGNSLVVDGAKSLTLSGTVNTLSVGHGTGATGNTAEILNTETVSLNGDLNLGVGSGSSDSSVLVSNVTAMSIAGDVKVCANSSLRMCDVGSLTLGASKAVVANGSVLLDNVPAVPVTVKSGAEVEIRNGTGYSFAETTTLNGGSLVVSNMTDLTLARVNLYDGARVEVRDSKVTFTGQPVICGGHFVLANPAAGTVYPATVWLNGGNTTESSAFLMMPPDYDMKNVHVNNAESEFMRTLVYDAGGGSYASDTLTGFLASEEGAKNVSVEFRNGTFTLGTSAQRYRPGNHPNRTYIIGRGATLTAPATVNGMTFYQEGGTAEFGETVPGIAIVADGGTIDFPDKGTGGYNMGSTGWGAGSILTIRNGGRMCLGADFQIGNESGIADDCRFSVLSGGSLTAHDFYIRTSNNRVTVSDATVSVQNCYWPQSGSCWPSGGRWPYADIAGKPRPATNNVIRLEGASARIAATGSLYSYQDAGQRTGFALEFVVPADGYAEPPITVAQDVVLQGSNRLHVDASAYAGEGQWITLMTVGGNLTVADWTAFVSELPEGCKARLVTGSTPKKLQIHLGEWPGMMLIVR